MTDAPVGEDVLLLPFAHQDSRSPYRASGPIFVRRGLRKAARIVNELPSYLTLRPLSVRAYDAADEMVDAEVVDGAAAAPLIGAIPRARRRELPAHSLRAPRLLRLPRRPGLSRVIRPSRAAD